MDAGAYRERVTVEKCDYKEDEVGNQKTVWEEYYRGYAYVNNLSGSEYWEAAQTQSQNTTVFIFRYHPLLEAIQTRGFRLVHRGKEYDITSVDNVQYKNETVKIRATAKE